MHLGELINFHGVLDISYRFYEDDLRAAIQSYSEIQIPSVRFSSQQFPFLNTYRLQSSRYSELFCVIIVRVNTDIALTCIHHHLSSVYYRT